MMLSAICSVRSGGGNGSGGGGGGARRPLVQELSSSAAVEEVPEHELSVEAAALTLVIKVPRVATVADLDVEIGERQLTLRAEGLYTLDVPLPQPVRSDDAYCKFDRKKRVLTVTMPL